MTDLTEVAQSSAAVKAGRREFLTRLGSAGLGVAAGTIIAGCGGGGSNGSFSTGGNGSTMAQGNGTPSPTDVLNFALNLEYLEAEFYSQSVSGTYLASQGVANTGRATGGHQISFGSTELTDIAQQIAYDEITHVRLLQSALASAAIPEPAINLNALDATLAAAGITVGSPTYFLVLARAFEDTGVSAYAGAAALLSGSTLTTAARILATEAYHASTLRLKIIQGEETGGPTPPPTDANDVPPSLTGRNIFTVDNNALAIARTPQQVLGIVFGASTASTTTPPAGVTSGAFFPSGVNGNIKST